MLVTCTEFSHFLPTKFQKNMKMKNLTLLDKLYYKSYSRRNNTVKDQSVTYIIFSPVSLITSLSSKFITTSS